MYLVNLSRVAIFFNPLYILGAGPGLAGEGVADRRGGGSSQVTLSPLSSNINSKRGHLLAELFG